MKLKADFSGTWPSDCHKFHHSQLLCTWLDSHIYNCVWVHGTLAYMLSQPCLWFIQINEAKNPPHTFHILLWPFDLPRFVLLSVTPTFRTNLSYPCQLYLILSASYYHFVYIYTYYSLYHISAETWTMPYLHEMPNNYSLTHSQLGLTLPTMISRRT